MLLRVDQCMIVSNLPPSALDEGNKKDLTVRDVVGIRDP